MTQTSGGALMDVQNLKKVALKDESSVNSFPIDGEGYWFSKNAENFKDLGVGDSSYGWKTVGAGYGSLVGQSTTDCVLSGVFTGDGVLKSFTGGTVAVGVRKQPLSLFGVFAFGNRAWSANSDTRQEITGRVVAEGDGATLSYSFYVGTSSILPSSLSLVHTEGGNQRTGTDNGGGVITGTNIASATVDYETGLIAVTFTNAPDLNVAIAVTYTVDSWLSIEHAENVGEGTGAQTVYSLLELANVYVKERSFRLKATISSAEYYFVDDGAGNLTEIGNGGMLTSGTINYTSGAVAITFASAPGDGTVISVTYQRKGLNKFAITHADGTGIAARFDVEPTNGSRVLVIGQKAVATESGIGITSGILVLGKAGVKAGIRTLAAYIDESSEAYAVPYRVMKCVPGSEYVVSFYGKTFGGNGSCYIRAWSGASGAGQQISFPASKYDWEKLKGVVTLVDDPANPGTTVLKCSMTTALSRFGARLRAPAGAACLSMSFEADGSSTYLGENSLWVSGIQFGLGSALVGFASSVATVAVLRPSEAVEGQYLKIGPDGTIVSAEVTVEGGAGGGITSLNALTSPAQTLAIGTTGTAPTFSSVGATHTLNIPMASTTGTTAGLLSKAEFDTLSGAIKSINGLTNSNQTFAINATGTNANPSITSSSDTNGNIHTFSFPMASSTNTTAGLISNSDLVTLQQPYTTLQLPVPEGLSVGVNEICEILSAELVKGRAIQEIQEAIFNNKNSDYISVAMLDSSKAIVCYRDNGNFSYGTACVLSISGTTVTAGTPVVFESANSPYISVAMLDSSKAIVCYRDGGNANYGTACVLSISGTTVTAGTPVVFESATSSYISVAMLDSSKAIVCYRDDGNAGYGTACVLSISGTTVTAGTPVVFESANSEYISVAMLDSSKAIVCYTDNGNSSYGTACVLSISGTTVTAGTPVVFESAYSDYFSVAMLDSSKAIVCYRDNGNSSYGTACVLSISGTTVTAGTPVVFESASSYYFSVAMLDSSKAIVCYQDGGNSYYGTACVLSISGTTVTAGTPVVFESTSPSYISVVHSGGNIICGYFGAGEGRAKLLNPVVATYSGGVARLKAMFDPKVFESATSTYISVAMLDSSKAIVCYQDGGNSSYGTACVLSISGTTVTAGTPVVFESANSTYTSVAMLDSSKAIVCYTDGGNSSYGTACVLSISGTTVTAGTPVVFESANSTYTSVAMLDSSKAIVCYRDGGNSGYGTACVLSISGTTVTAGTPVVFESATSTYISVAMLDSSKAIVCYRDGGNSNYGTACVLSISGTTVTAGTPVVFESAGSPYISVAMLDSSKAIVCYQDGENANYGTACVLSISGTTVTAGTPVVFESANSSYISVAMLDSSKAIVCYRDDGNAAYGTACVLSISGTTVTAGTPVVFESANSDYTSVAMLDSSKAIVCYTDNGNSSYGTACVLSISGTTVQKTTPILTGQYLGFVSSYSAPNAVINLGPVVPLFSGLSVGSTYYNTVSGVGLSGKDKIGVAVSSTSINLRLPDLT
jgi:hypothetical protein